MAVGTTRGKRRLGRFVKPIRLRGNLEVKEVAKSAMCSRQSITRLEAGDALPRIHLFLTILSVIGATDEERERALRLWEVADADTAVIEQADDLPAKYRRFRMDETEAVRERTLDTVLIPGILQTADYALAISHGRRRLLHSESWQQRAAQDRRERQELLQRKENPLKLHALIDESALRREIGGPAVMADQLDHLLRMMKLPNVTVQVIPLDFGAHGAMSGAPTLLSFPEEDEPDAAYVESTIGLQIAGDLKDVAALSAVWDEVAAAAPSAKRSADIIRAARNSVRE